MEKFVIEILEKCTFKKKFRQTIKPHIIHFILICNPGLYVVVLCFRKYDAGKIEEVWILFFNIIGLKFQKVQR